MEKKILTVGPMPTNDKRKQPAPSIWLSGTWLREYGFEVGDSLEVIRGRNMLILVKANGDKADTGKGGLRLAY